MANNLIQIKRSNTSSTPGTTLYAGELAYSYSSNNLFIGAQTGISTAAVKIGGSKFGFLDNATQGSLTANAVQIMDANAFISNTFTSGLFVSSSIASPAANATAALITSITPQANSTQLGASAGGSNNELVTSWAIKTYVDAKTSVAAINTAAAYTWTGVQTFNANVVLGAGLSANNSYGTAGHVLHSNGTATYWAVDDNTTYDLLAVANTAANEGRARLSASTAANDDVLFIGVDDLTVFSNATAVYIDHNDITRTNSTTGNTAPGYGGTFTAVDSITTNARGHVTGVNTKTVTMPPSNNTTYDLAAVTNTAINAGLVRLTDSALSNDTVTFTGTGGATVSSNSTHVIINSTDNNTTYDLTAVANTAVNAGLLRLTDSALSNDTVTFTGTGSASVSSNATHIVINATDTNETYVIKNIANTIANQARIQLLPSVDPTSNTTAVFVGGGTTTVSANTTALLISSSDQFTGTVTSVASGSGLTGGTITGSGTLSVLANSGITANATGVFVNAQTGLVANATGLYVNASYIATLSANNADFLDGQHGSYYTNATNITTGTLPYAQLPANVAIWSNNNTFTGTQTFNDVTINGNTTLGNATTDVVRFVAQVNSAITASANVTYDLGTSTNYWRDIRVGNVYATSGNFTGNLSVGGNILVTGNLVTQNVSSVIISDPMIYLAGNNYSSDLVDIGFAANYNNGSANVHTGLIRKAATDNYYLFVGSTQELDANNTVNTTAVGFRSATLYAFLNSGALTSSNTAVAITANSTISVTITANSVTLGTPLAATSGGTGQNSYTAGQMLYATNTTALGKLSIGTFGTVLQTNSSGLPQFDTLDGGTF